MGSMPEQTSEQRSVHSHPRDTSTVNHDPSRPWTNTRPRGANPEPHRSDFERSVERFNALVGR